MMSQIFNVIVTILSELFWLILRFTIATETGYNRFLEFDSGVLIILVSLFMVALNIPLISWCIIVVAMTVFISVRLFHKSCNPVQQKIVSKRGRTMNDVKY